MGEIKCGAVPVINTNDTRQYLKPAKDNSQTDYRDYCKLCANHFEDVDLSYRKYSRNFILILCILLLLGITFMAIVTVICNFILKEVFNTH